MSESILPTPPRPLGVTRLTTTLTATSSPDQRLPPTLAIGARLEVQLTQSLSANRIEVRLRAPGQNIPWSAATRLQLSSPLPEPLARQLAAGVDARAASANPVRIQADVVALSPTLTLRVLPLDIQTPGSAILPPTAGTREWMDAQLRQHLPQSRPLASTLESWIRRLSSADGLDTLSVRQSPLATDTTPRMIATILSRLATTAELTDPERLPVALRQSGLWLESLMAQAAANPTQKIDLSLDLKGQLLRLAQQIRAANQNQVPSAPPTEPGATSPSRPPPEQGTPSPSSNPPPAGRAPPAPPTDPGATLPNRPPPEPGASSPSSNPPSTGRMPPATSTEPGTTSPSRPQPEPGTSNPSTNPLSTGRMPPATSTEPGTTSPSRPQPEPGTSNPSTNPLSTGRMPPATPTEPDTTSPSRPQPEPGAPNPSSNPPPAGRTPFAPLTEPGASPLNRPPPEPGASSPSEPIRTSDQAPSSDRSSPPQTRTPGTETPQSGNLAREVDGMIKQVVTQQLQTLEAGADPPRWVLELPFKTPAGLLTLEADIQRETRAGQTREDGWNMRIRLNLPRLGPLSINLNLRADRLHAALQAENQTAVDILRQHLATLRQQLEDRQIEIASLHASQRPRNEQPPIRRPPLVSEQA